MDRYRGTAWPGRKNNVDDGYGQDYDGEIFANDSAFVGSLGGFYGTGS